MDEHEAVEQARRCRKSYFEAVRLGQAEIVPLPRKYRRMFEEGRRRPQYWWGLVTWAVETRRPGAVLRYGLRMLGVMVWYVGRRELPEDWDWSKRRLRRELDGIAETQAEFDSRAEVVN